jgi:hypothetical protein
MPHPLALAIGSAAAGAVLGGVALSYATIKRMNAQGYLTPAGAQAMGLAAGSGSSPSSGAVLPPGTSSGDGSGGA